MSLEIGYEVGTGKEVAVPCFHMLTTGQTRLSGKTTVCKILARKAAEKGFKILAIDAKSNMQDYEGFGKEIPVCLQQSTDSLVLISLVEAIFERRITSHYATLTRVSENAKNFDDVIENAKVLISKSRAGFVKDACRTLIDLLERLKKQTSKVKTTQTLELPHQINRMCIGKRSDLKAGFDRPSQQLIVKTVFEEALRKYKKLIIILDEGFVFLPQKYRSACARAIQEYVTQGGATECYLWLSTQFLAPTSKDAMKTMAVKLLGTQDHDTECEHTVDLIPFSKQKYTNDTIMSLKLGHFIVVTKEWVKTVYVVPEYADKNECLEVALGRRDPKDIHYVVLVSAEDLKKLRKPMPMQLKISEKTSIQKDFFESKPLPENVEIKINEPPKETDMQKLARGESLEDILAPSIKSMITGFTKEFTKKLAKFEKAPGYTAPKEPPKPSVERDITLQQTTTKVHLEKVEKHVTVSDATLRGKILTLAQESFFKGWHPLREVVGALEDHKWTVKSKSVLSELARMSEEGLLGRRKRSGEYIYALSPNIIFD